VARFAALNEAKPSKLGMVTACDGKNLVDHDESGETHRNICLPVFGLCGLSELDVALEAGTRMAAELVAISHTGDGRFLPRYTSSGSSRSFGEYRSYEHIGWTGSDLVRIHRGISFDLRCCLLGRRIFPSDLGLSRIDGQKIGPNTERPKP
jgi:hypothetical protein